jgi:hypothetical protein
MVRISLRFRVSVMVNIRVRAMARAWVRVKDNVRFRTMDRLELGLH